MERTNESTAIYARSACEGDGHSIGDQIRACRAYADRMGMRIDDTHVYTDTGVSGATTTGRPGLTGLLEFAQRDPRPFAVVIVQDTSRLGRCLSDVLRILDIFDARGISIYSVDLEGEVSSLLIEHSVSNGFYFGNLSHAVRRGQTACVAKGLTPGGRRYGYDNVPVVDPTRTVGGRPMVTGFKATINPVEAAVVRRIFDLRASGLSYRRVADLLNVGNSSASNNLRKWGASTVCATVNNPIYQGRILYGRTRRFRNPETGKSVAKRLPQSEWKHVENPDVRIVSDELWRKAQGDDEDRRPR